MKLIKAADLFCGAGGTSSGLVEACQEEGYRVDLTAVNHWDIAIATHSTNHPGARHFCASLDSLNPRELYSEGDLDILWASPECTHHSSARGGRPVNDQSRATAWCVTRWAEALRPKIILVENVKEFEGWGPVIKVKRKVTVKVPKIGFRKWLRRHRSAKKLPAQKLTRKEWQLRCPKVEVEVDKMVWIPDPKRKGEIFHAWIKTLEAIGYRVDWKILCAADYGDPTTRRRLFIQAVLGKRKIVWPEPTHVQEIGEDLFGKKVKRWVPARDIIDWTNPGVSIFNRKKPLCDKTMRRIWIGLQKYGMQPFVLGQQSGAQPRGVSDPIPTIATQGAISMVQSYLLKARGQSTVGSVDDPVPTVTTTGAGHIGLCNSYLVKLRGTNTVADLSNPTPAVTANGTHLALCQAFILKHPETKGDGVRTIDKPLNTITATSSDISLVQPYLVQVSHGGESDRSRPIDKPLPTVTCGHANGDGRNMAVCQPLLVPIDHQTSESSPVKTADAPLSTITSKQRHAVAVPYLVACAHGNEKGKDVDSRSAKSIEEPIGTVHAGGGNFAVAVPFLEKANSKAAEKPLLVNYRCRKCGFEMVSKHRKCPTCFHRDIEKLENPKPLLERKKNDESDPVNLNPFLTKFYGTATATTVDAPLDAVTTKDRFGLVQPVININGEDYILDILFRMLTPRELARAQGFSDNYQFTGNTSEVVKQIGNAVPRNLAKALVKAAITQQP